MIDIPCHQLGALVELSHLPGQDADLIKEDPQWRAGGPVFLLQLVFTVPSKGLRLASRGTDPAPPRRHAELRRFTASRPHTLRGLPFFPSWPRSSQAPAACSFLTTRWIQNCMTMALIKIYNPHVAALQGGGWCSGLCKR